MSGRGASCVSLFLLVLLHAAAFAQSPVTRRPSTPARRSSNSPSSSRAKTGGTSSISSRKTCRSSRADMRATWRSFITRARRRRHPRAGPAVAARHLHQSSRIRAGAAAKHHRHPDRFIEHAGRGSGESSRAYPRVRQRRPERYSRRRFIAPVSASMSFTISRTTSRRSASG